MVYLIMMSLDALLSINYVERKGLEPLDVVFHYFDHKNAAYDRLADIVEEHLDMDYIMSTLG